LSEPKKIKKIVSDDPVLESLIDACLVNNRKAQIEIYNRFANNMFNVSYRMVKDKMLAEDITQEAFISAFKGLRNFRREVSFYSWLKRIVINKSLDEIRRRKAVLTDFNEELIAEELTDDEDYDTNREEMLNRIKSELFNLPDGYRIIISLYYLEGFDHEEISQILHISSSTSRSQLTRAKKLIRKRMTTENTK
jgi:RNA polymerase sigma-70 factor (ECF subfamily)